MWSDHIDERREKKRLLISLGTGGHICHAGPPPQAHVLVCPTGEHPTGWQHPPGPHKTCQDCQQKDEK